MTTDKLSPKLNSFGSDLAGATRMFKLTTFMNLCLINETLGNVSECQIYRSSKMQML